MKSGFLPILGGALLLAGCSSQSTGSPTPTAASIAARPTNHPHATVDPTSGTASGTAPATAAPAATHTSTARIASGSAYQQGRADVRAGNYTASITAFKSAIAAHQHVPDSYAGLGTAYLGLRQYAPAYKAYRSALQQAPRVAPYAYYTAYSALYARDFHAAVTYATKYVQLKPSDPLGYHLRFLAYGQLLDHKHQVKDARMVVTLQPRKPDGYNDLGIALTNDNQFKPAIAAFSRAISLNPRAIAYYQNRAFAEDYNKQPESAVKDLQKARSMTTSPVSQKQLDQAIAALKKQIKHT